MTYLISELINYRGVCRTPLATLGLLNISGYGQHFLKESFAPSLFFLKLQLQLNIYIYFGQDVLYTLHCFKSHSEHLVESQVYKQYFCLNIIESQNLHEKIVSIVLQPNFQRIGPEADSFQQSHGVCMYVCMQTF